MFFPASNMVIYWDTMFCFGFNGITLDEKQHARTEFGSTGNGDSWGI